MQASELPFISVVIRAYNEANLLDELLESISQQDYPKDRVQLILVDNGSTDNTAEVGKKHGCKVVELPQAEFTYPKSLNLGFAQAKHEIVFSLSGHCLLRGTEYFKNAVRHFTNPKVAGVAGTTLPRHPYTFPEWLFMYSGYFKYLIQGVRVESQAKPGVLQNVNSAIRLSLWKQHHFNEEWASGAEDVEWAGWALSQGYLALSDPRMTVCHSHQLSWIGLYKQFKLWNKVLHDHEFRVEDLSFRKDIKRS